MSRYLTGSLVIFLGVILLLILPTSRPSEVRGQTVPTPTPQGGPTATPVNLPVDDYVPAVFNPESTSSPAPVTVDVSITHIHYDGSGMSKPDAYVEFRNDGTAVQLAGWTLRDDANHVYTFPPFVMAPGQRCRVYTNEYHPGWCGFSFDSIFAIWNNNGDCAFLRTASNAPLDTYCYP